MKKIGKMAEASWLIGTVLCAFGVVLCTKADFGLSMMAAPPYIIHVTLQKFFAWYTQGTSEYIWQAILLILMCVIVGKFKPKYLLCFLTSVFFGFCIDGWLLLFGGNGGFEDMWVRIASFIIGELSISLSVAFVFKTYLPPQIAECTVMEIAKRFNIAQTKIKLINDVSCLVLSFALSLILTKGFTGVGIGTVIITFANAPLIKLWTKLLDKLFDFDPLFPKLKERFEK